MEKAYKSINKDISLPRVRRVRKRPEFLKIQDKGKKLRTKHFLISIISRADSKDSRLGITVTKKVHKRAVKRNQIKRRVREVFRHARPRFDQHGDIVVIALVGASELDFGQISRQLTFLFYKSKLLKEKSTKRSG